MFCKDWEAGARDWAGAPRTPAQVRRGGPICGNLKKDTLTVHEHGRARSCVSVAGGAHECS